MDKIINFTRLRDNDNAIAKKISWDGNKLVKEAKASIKDGYAVSAQLNWTDFKDYLTDIPPDECIVLGGFKHGVSCNIVGSKSAQKVTQNKFNRSLDNFEWNPDYQLLCLDFDDSKTGTMSPEQLISVIDGIMPGFGNIKKVIKYSSSAWIYDDHGELLSPTNGFHIYFMVNHPERIEELFRGTGSWLHKKLWLAGYGYIKNSNPKDLSTTAVSQYERTIYDSHVFSPERIIFEAPPELIGNLRKANNDAIYHAGDYDYLELSTYGSFSDDESRQYISIVNQAKNENDQSEFVIKSKEIFKENIRKRVESGEYNNRKEYTGKSSEEIVDLEYKASKEKLLMQDHVIELASGTTVTVEDILRNPSEYHEKHCKDPHEPDYGTSSIGIIYSDQNAPIIYSHAHGGVKFRMLSKTHMETPDFTSRQYWLDHFYIAAYNKKDEIYHINGNKIELYSHSGFKHKFSGYTTDVGDTENSKRIPLTSWWMNRTDKKCISDDCFQPNKPIIYERYGELVLNEYVPEILKEGFPTPLEEQYTEYAGLWLSHIRQMVHDPSDAEIVIDFFSYLIQHPEERPMFSLLIQSETRGVGKDIITDIFTQMLGHQYSKKSTISDLSNESGWGDIFYQTKLITVSECGSSTDRYTVGNSIKDAITSNHRTMNMKGKEVKFGQVYAGIVFFSNSMFPFRLDDGDRRFFVTRCDWSKSDTDKLKESGHFKELATYYYSEPKHLHGLYHYLLNREIKTNMKGDAPMTSTKELIMKSEPNEVEQFFVDLKEHPSKYWTKSMIDHLFRKVCPGLTNDSDNKQYKHFLKNMVDVGRMKIKGKSHRVKTFKMKDADVDTVEIRANITENWDITTNTLFPHETKSVVRTKGVLETCSSVSYDDFSDPDVEHLTVPSAYSLNSHRGVEGVTI